tara:strand:+ start:612 stop:713 length:102 start_codon:yes stop_codon:yes gene_type:complete
MVGMGDAGKKLRPLRKSLSPEFDRSIFSYDHVG